MVDISEYLTPYEIDRRQKNEEICREYLERSEVITSGQIRPNRVLDLLARKYGRSIMGVKKILKEAGIYKDGKQPVIIPPNWQGSTPQTVA